MRTAPGPRTGGLRTSWTRSGLSPGVRSARGSADGDRHMAALGALGVPQGLVGTAEEAEGDCIGAVELGDAHVEPRGRAVRAVEARGDSGGELRGLGRGGLG